MASSSSTPAEEIILRTLWGLRAFRESFLDSHKALVRNTNSDERISMLRVQRGLARAFSGIRRNTKKQKKEIKKKKKKKRKKKNKTNADEDDITDNDTDDTTTTTTVPNLDTIPLKSMLDRVYTQSMDGRTESCSLLFDLLYMLYDPPPENVEKKSVLSGFNGGGSFFVDDRAHSMGRNNRRVTTRKRSRETWDLSNIFRHEVTVNWITPIDHNSTSLSSLEYQEHQEKQLSHRTAKQLDKVHGCLLPNQCFRFWHVIDVATMLDLHDELSRQEYRDSMTDFIDDLEQQDKEQNKNNDVDSWKIKDAEDADDANDADTDGNDNSNTIDVDIDEEGKRNNNTETGNNTETKKKKEIEGTLNQENLATNDDNNSVTSFCFGREDIVEKIKNTTSQSTASSSNGRTRGQGDLGHVMRELLELEAYVEKVKLGAMEKSIRPSFTLNMRPDVLCIRLEWPSTNVLRSARMTNVGLHLVFNTLKTTHLSLYEVFDIIGGKRKDNRTPYNTTACTYTLTHIVCSSLGIQNQNKNQNKNQNRNQNKNQNRNQNNNQHMDERSDKSSSSHHGKQRKKIKENKRLGKKGNATNSNANFNTNATKTTYYGIARDRKSKNLKEEKDEWNIIPLGGDIDDPLQSQEAMPFENVHKLCRERKIFPEFLFFESNGPTQRDLRSKERQHRVGGTSTPSVDILTSPSRTSPSSQSSPHQNYGTIGDARDEKEQDEDDGNSFVLPEGEDGNMCEGVGCSLM